MMERPYRHHTREELGDEFASAVKLGGRPMCQIRGQIAYADLALAVVLDEYRQRDYEARSRELAADAEAEAGTAPF